jgi:uncharacterized protein (TIGR01777 family)
MKILLTGSTGLVGSELKDLLISTGHEVFTLIRNRNLKDEKSFFWDYELKVLDINQIKDIDCVIHLAGENISARHWSKRRKQKILDSRIESTKFLIDSILKLQNKPHTFICASAIGYYGNRKDEILNEQSGKGTGFLSDVCDEWEKSTNKAKEDGIRLVNLRFGVILSDKGGALKKMLFPFKLDLGGKIGSGKQYMSWITLEDTIRAICFCLNNDEITGPVNIVAPNPVTNSQLTKSLGKHLKRPTFFPLPAFAAKIVLGEMADELLLASTRVEPSILLRYEFDFKYKMLDEALFKLI